MHHPDNIASQETTYNEACIADAPHNLQYYQ